MGPSLSELNPDPAKFGAQEKNDPGPILNDGATYGRNEVREHKSLPELIPTPPQAGSGEQHVTPAPKFGT